MDSTMFIHIYHIIIIMDVPTTAVRINIKDGVRLLTIKQRYKKTTPGAYQMYGPGVNAPKEVRQMLFWDSGDGATISPKGHSREQDGTEYRQGSERCLAKCT
jgi:hypothetical protein